MFDISMIKCSEIADLVFSFISNGGKLPAISERYVVLPGFCDVHVHFREPGFSYKETVRTGCMAAARGGYTTVCTMPNLRPAPDCLKGLEAQLEIIKRDACIEVIPYGTITRGEEGEELSAMEELSHAVCAFSDDGRGVQSEELMRRAMECAKALGKVIAAHCEDSSLLSGGYIHDGAYARAHGHKGISSESEYIQIERDLRLAKETGVRYHVCHVSTKEGVELIRRSKKEGVDVTCETAPHYLVLCDEDLQEEGRFRMNPPLRSKEDREALIRGLIDGTVDMIATDHAPHSAQEKSGGLAGSAFGVVGLETAFPVLYTELVKKGILTVEKLSELMSLRPRNRFDIPQRGDFTVFETDTSYKIDPAEFLSKGRSTPFEGMTVYGKCILTVCGGQVVYENGRQILQN